MDPVWFFLLVMDILIYESDRHFSSLVLCRMNKYCILWMTIKINHSHACPGLLGNTEPVKRRQLTKLVLITRLCSLCRSQLLSTRFTTLSLSFLFFHFSQAALVLSCVAFVSLTQRNSHELRRWWQYSRHPQILCLSFTCALHPSIMSIRIPFTSLMAWLFCFFSSSTFCSTNILNKGAAITMLSLTHTHALVPDHWSLPLDPYPDPWLFHSLGLLCNWTRVGQRNDVTCAPVYQNLVWCRA